MSIFMYYIFVLIHKNGLPLIQGCGNDDEREKKQCRVSAIMNH